MLWTKQEKDCYTTLRMVDLCKYSSSFSNKLILGSTFIFAEL